jgi:Flp pilus assembly protein TadD
MCRRVTPLFSLVVLALASIAPAQADQNDPQLEILFEQLHQATSPAVAVPLEADIWQRWVSHDNPAFQNLMLQGIGQMNSGDVQGALTTYNQLIAQAPDYAEAWNKRATIYFMLGNYEASDADISKTLALEPFHFGALSGRGLVYSAMRKYEQARSALHAALEVHPNMVGVKANLAELNALLLKRSI